MKKVLLTTIIILLFFITRVNASVLTYNESYNLEYPISDIIEVNNAYYTIYDNQISKFEKNMKYDSDKTLEDIHNAQIIKYNDNILLVGNKNNFVSIYLLNTDLQVINSVDTTILYYKPNLYSYNNNIYMLLGEDYILEDTNMYEINSNLEIKTDSISSYTNLKDIIKSDYYAFNNDDLTKQVTATAYNTDYIVLGGTDFLQVLDKEGKIVKEIESNPIVDILILNNKIVVAEERFVKQYNFDLEFEEKITSTEEGFSFMTKLNDNVIIFQAPDVISFYKFNINIFKEESSFGTIEISENAAPNTKVTYTITPNSGYEVDNILITDEYGNVIKTNGEYFIAPSSDVKVLVTFKEAVINPETIDLIAVVIVVAVVTLLIFVKLYKKFKWINN